MLVREMQEACNEKFLLQKSLSYKTSWWGKQMTNSWISQIASSFYAHTLIFLILIFHMKARSSCLPSLMRNTVKLCSSPACCHLTQSPACSATSYFRITLASSNRSLVALLRYLLFRLNNYSSVNHSPDMSCLVLISLQLHERCDLGHPKSPGKPGAHR